MHSNYDQASPVVAAPQTDANNLIGKSVAGYQCWFKCGTADQGWHHWSGGSAPAPGHLTFEVYPDVSEYPDDILYETKFGPMPDGKPSRLFMSRTPSAIDIQLRWMKDYGIDGAAVQRFYSDAMAVDQHGVLRDDASHLTLIRDAAEKHGRIFYMMYDVSGAGRVGMDALPNLQRDLLVNLEGKGIISSPVYAHADGKPVLCIWGLNSKEPRRYPGAAVMVPFIQWLKKRGYFVIGGISDNSWTEDDTEYSQVYQLLDMVSPWTVGRYGPETVEQWLQVHMAKDLAYCETYQKVYQPVLFPGFAWSTWVGEKPNHIPRQSGKFLWKQAKIYREAGIRNLYFAMFDEYDEGTAYMKAAEDSASLPTGEQYFQPLCADGDWLSSDFYLRLAGKITQIVREQAPMGNKIPVPFSEGPVYWRNGFEKRKAYVRVHRRAPAYPVLTDIDIGAPAAQVLEAKKGRAVAASVIHDDGGQLCHRGEYAFAFSGVVAEDGYLVYKLADANIPVNKPIKLSYAIRPGDEGGQKVAMDVLLDDGTRFSQLNPEVFSVSRGKIGQWRTVEYPLGEAVIGKTIVAVMLTVVGSHGFSAIIDDMCISDC